MRFRTICSAALALAIAAPAAQAEEAPAPATSPSAFRDLFREIVETDTSPSTGSCTALAQKLAARFRKAGFPDEQLTLFGDAAFPRDGGLVVTVPGTSAKARPMLLLGHIDVVNVRPALWHTPPFMLTEKNGYFYGRGVADMKALDAIWVDTLIRLRAEGFRAKRTIKLALTCGHESSAQTNGVEWLASHRPDLLQAEFALTEGGGGRTDGHGRLENLSIGIGEMTLANYEIEMFSEGGMSAIPNYDNAISRLIDALQKVRAYRFPLHLNDTTRRYLAQVGAARGDAMGDAMLRLAADPSDSKADAVVSSDRYYYPMLHTTCLTTIIQGGTIATAIPQTAKATINCYIVPGETAKTTRTALFNAIGDPQLVMTRVGRAAPPPVLPPHDPRIIRPAAKLVARYFPGVELVPAINLLATDAAYLGPLGIPAYGAPGLYIDPDGNEAHGHDERIAVDAVNRARDLLHDLVKEYAGQE